MKTISLECSTSQASVALLEYEELVHEEIWITERARHENIADRAAAVMGSAGWRWDEIELFVVGRGPGAYSGLRASLLAIQALAAPGGKSVVAVSSMDALAERLLREHNIDAITLVGDARRQSIWLGTCRRQLQAHQPTSWRVEPVTSAIIDQNTVVATPHWDSLADFRARRSDLTWIGESQCPCARDVARLARLRRAAGAPPEPPVPLYLHDAV